MTDNYKSKSYKRSKEDDEKVVSKSKRHKYIEDSKTPPLPNLHGSSIKELLRERDLLRKELKISTRHTTSSKHSRSKTKSSKNDSKKWKHTKDDRDHSHSSKKNHHHKSGHHSKEIIHELSPEYQEYNQLDSEDEESIIEQRRKQRKQLLEKYNISDDNKSNQEDVNHRQESKNTTSNRDILESNITSDEKQEKHATDMFSEKDDFIPNSHNEKIKTNKESNLHLTDNWDDTEGYYRTIIGEVIYNKYTIKDILGQGVFANVVRAQHNHENENFAIKIIRNNELMYKTGLKEISILKEINDADPDNKYHCVKFYEHFLYRGHLCIVLEPLHMDLRSVIKKYGKNRGINLKAIISYTRQLFLALRLLKKIGIIHADVKPDNILVNDKKNILKLCDFGSAFKIDENEPTPYLVSRFYRAPEIILGIPYKFGVDAWSAACTVYEISTGKILFTGSSNNKMLKCFMDLKGKIPNKLVKKGKFKDQHFNDNNNFLHNTKDTFNGKEKRIEISNINVIRDLNDELKDSCRNLTDFEDKKLSQLKDLLDKMLMLDPAQRLSITDCLKHPFVQEELKK